MVSFHVNPEKYNGPSMADHIDEEVHCLKFYQLEPYSLYFPHTQMRKCIEIEKKLSSFDQKIAVDQKFIQRVSFNRC